MRLPSILLASLVALAAVLAACDDGADDLADDRDAIEAPRSPADGGDDDPGDRTDEPAPATLPAGFWLPEDAEITDERARPGAYEVHFTTGLDPEELVAAFEEHLEAAGYEVQTPGGRGDMRSVGYRADDGANGSIQVRPGEDGGSTVSVYHGE